MPSTDPMIIVIFGASGDLTARKLIPSLFNLYTGGFLSNNFVILGTGRTAYSDKGFREKVIYDNDLISKRLEGVTQEKVDAFAQNIYYQDNGDKESSEFEVLKNRIEALDKTHEIGGNYLFYLSTPPSVFEYLAKNLCEQGLSDEETGWKRIIVEKPFGYSLDTARDLNKGLLRYFQEHQIYRIDHYLGKETVQNLLVTRFSNTIFEPLWNRKYIEHIEITNAEDLGVGTRGGYYDTSGALRDMFQNHLMQIVTLVAMEPPARMSADSIRNEKLKVLQSFRPWTEESLRTNTIRGQYVRSMVRGEWVDGYRETEGVDPDSKTETYAAVKFYVDNWRWHGVPFYVRTAKMMPTKVTEVVVHFRNNPINLFDDQPTDNKLILRIQPNEGILLKFDMKVPGQGFKVENVAMDFHYSDLKGAYVPEAYERLLLDALQGDATLFARGDEVEASWAFVDPILEAWENDPAIKMYGYPAGTWGPELADGLIDGMKTWRYPCKNLAEDGEFCEL